MSNDAQVAGPATSETLFPEEIDANDLADACKAFFEALGLNGAGVYVPMIIGRDEIYLNVVPGTRPGAEYPEAVKAPASAHPQGSEFGEFAIPIRIKVVG